MIHAPRVKAAQRTPQLGKELLRVCVLDETRVAVESAQIFPHINLLDKIGDRLNGSCFRQPIADHAVHAPAPVFVIPPHHLFRQRSQRLPIDLHNQPVRLQARIHPVERGTLLDVEFVVRIPVEDDFGQQAVDAHDRRLPADLDAA